MKCPSCNTDNKLDACFCHNCGNKLKENEFEKKIKELEYDKSLRWGWYKEEKKKLKIWKIMFAIACFILLMIVVVIINYKNEISNLKYEKIEFAKEIKNNNEKYEKELKKYLDEISIQLKEIEKKNSDILTLKSKLPQTYKTLYANQYFYFKCGTSAWEKLNCYRIYKGSTIDIYKEQDGYGLTESGGWIPMYCLEKYYD